MFNAHGDVVQRLAEGANAAPMYHYDAFGNQREITETDPNPFRYCGEYYDEELGEIYLRARYYDTRTGRFGAEDRVRFATVGNKDGAIDPDSLNLYKYADNNPVRYYDSSGYAWLAVAGVALLAGFIGGTFDAITAASNGENVLTAFLGGFVETALVTGFATVSFGVGLFVHICASAANNQLQAIVNESEVDAGTALLDMAAGTLSYVVGEGAGYIIEELANSRLSKFIGDVLYNFLSGVFDVSQNYNYSSNPRQAPRRPGIMTPEEIIAAVRERSASSSSQQPRSSSSPAKPPSKPPSRPPITPESISRRIDYRNAYQAAVENTGTSWKPPMSANPDPKWIGWAPGVGTNFRWL